MNQFKKKTNSRKSPKLKSNHSKTQDLRIRLVRKTDFQRQQSINQTKTAAFDSQQSK